MTDSTAGDDQASVHIEEGPEQPTIAVRIVAAMSDLDVGAVFGESMMRLSEQLTASQVSSTGAPYARYHEWGPERADMELGLPVAATPADLTGLDTCPIGEIGAAVLPGGPHAVTVHIGPYSDLGVAFARVKGWLEDNDRKAAGPPWESYLVMPDAVDNDPSRLRTEIRYPLS